MRYHRFVSFGEGFFEEFWSAGMEANETGSTRILQCPEEAKSPQRILVRSLLKSRNKLRAKYRELRAECKRWRNQAVAVERSRSTWHQRALTGEATAENEHAERVAVESQLQQVRERLEQRDAELAALRAQLAALEGAEKRGR
jgi:chromosome segregation ATPase